MIPNNPTLRLRTVLCSAGLVVGGLIAVSCSSNAAPKPAVSAVSTASVATNPTGDPSVVLPVTDNPINNDSTVQALVIDSVLVENNVDTSGAAASDHLEIALSNSGSVDLSGFEIYYTLTDPTTSATENYYAKLPDSFTIASGAKRIVHFDDSGAPDHFPVNKFSLYYTDKNAMEVTVEVGAKDAATQTLTIQKDPGGAEAAD